MSLIEKQLSYVFSSDIANGAKNVSQDGDRFSVQLFTPISIPSNALNCYLKLTRATIWNTVPNISLEIGNNQLYVYTDYVSTGVPVLHVITITDGLYSLEGLNSFLARTFVSLGLPSNIIFISADESTQKTVLKFNQPNTWIDFTQLNTPREVLGFNSRNVPLVPQASGYSETADEVAKFNRTNSFLISGDLVSNGVPVNNINKGILGEVLITAPPGSQINYTPFLPPSIDATELIGKTKNFFTFTLTDQIGRSVDTNYETWSFLIVISYFVKV
tara:strand:- start:961 stop:1782 length:822 start_codon:yes stop_codon:yes gene_type:complete